jgi:N-acetylmuramoyl-L-alanine amidase
VNIEILLYNLWYIKNLCRNLYEKHGKWEGSMDRALLRKAAMQSVALMITVVVLSYSLNNYHTIVKAASFLIGSETVRTDAATPDKFNVKTGNEAGELLADSVTNSPSSHADIPITDISSLKLRIEESILKQLGENYLVIKKPEGEQLSISLKDLYINHSIQLDISRVSNPTMTNSMIYRVKGSELYHDEPAYTEVISYKEDGDTREKEEVVTKDYGNDLSHGIKITSKQEANSDLYSIELLIELDTVYAYSILEDSNYYYISLKKPTEVYDKVLVIDPGHGGKDVGAIAKNEEAYEKDINLGIVLELKKLLDQEDIKVYYTRTKNDTVFLRPRSSLANAVDCDYFISIHCNSNSLSYPNGTEVLFMDTKVKDVSNKALAGLLSEELSRTIPLIKKGSIEKKPEDIFIMDQARVPMVLIEVGYLSNSGDFNYLIKKDSQKAVAQGIFNGIMRAYKELPTSK